MVQQLAYISTSEVDDLEGEIDTILETSRRNNAELGVTGVLIYAQGTFFQVLEGEPDAVDKVYSRIETDPRHSNPTELLREEIPDRRFGGWEMGWSNIPQSHPLAERIAKFGRRETYALDGQDTEVDALIESFFELNRT